MIYNKSIFCINPGNFTIYNSSGLWFHAVWLKFPPFLWNTMLPSSRSKSDTCMKQAECLVLLFDPEDEVRTFL
jgi:hypothetical protein